MEYYKHMEFYSIDRIATGKKKDTKRINKYDSCLLRNYNTLFL